MNIKFIWAGRTCISPSGLPFIKQSWLCREVIKLHPKSKPLDLKSVFRQLDGSVLHAETHPETQRIPKPNSFFCSEKSAGFESKVWKNHPGQVPLRKRTIAKSRGHQLSDVSTEEFGVRGKKARKYFCPA